MQTKIRNFNPQFVIRNLKFVIDLASANEMHNLDSVCVFY